MTTNRPASKPLVTRYSLRHNTGNGFVGIPAAMNKPQTEVLTYLRELRKQGDKRNFVITDAAGNVVAHCEL